MIQNQYIELIDMNYKESIITKNTQLKVKTPMWIITLLRARLKQFFAEVKSPFFQMQLPKQSQASPRDGFSLTWRRKNIR